MEERMQEVFVVFDALKRAQVRVMFFFVPVAALMWFAPSVFWVLFGVLAIGFQAVAVSMSTAYLVLIMYVTISGFRWFAFQSPLVDGLAMIVLPLLVLLLMHWQYMERSRERSEQDDFFFKMDAQGNILGMNRRLAEFFGKSVKECMGASALNMGLLGVRDPLGRIRMHFSTEDSPLLLSWWVPSGNERLVWIQWSLRRSSSATSNQLAFEAVGRDLTEWKKEAEHDEQIHQQMQLLHGILLELHKVKDCDDVEKLLVQSADDLFSLAHCAVFWWDSGRMNLGGVSPAAEFEAFLPWASTDGLVWRAYEQGSLQKQQLPYSGAEAISFGSQYYRWGAAVPLGRFGVAAIVTPEVEGFNAADLEVLDLLSAHVQETITRLMSQEQLQFIHAHDGLTGLRNRAFFEQRLMEWDHPQYYPLTIVMGDINGLKFANDVFGHQTGDRLLKDAANILRHSIRQGDLAARLGGDEFVLLLPNTTEQQAHVLMKRVKDGCNRSASLPIQVSISMGAASHWGEESVWEVMANAEDRMYREKIEHSQRFKEELLESIQRMMHAKSHETIAHTERMKQLSLGFGRYLGLAERELADLGLAAVFHDMGLIALPESILKSTGSLSPTQWEEMRRHPEVGFRIAESSKTLGHIAPIILHHHEHWDGSGYPRGIRGEDIPYLARIIAIVDAFEVMTHGRPYAFERSYSDALAAIQEQTGKQFDPQLADSFVRFVQSEKKAGRFVPGTTKKSSQEETSSSVG